MHRWPLVLAGDGERIDARGPQLLDGGEVLVPRRRRRRDAGLLEERLVVPEADHAHVPGHAVLLAVVVVDAHGTGVDRVLPVGDVGGDVLEQAGVGLGGHDAAAPRLEQVRIVGSGRRGQLRLERLVLEDGDLDGDVRVFRHVGVGGGLEVGLAGVAGRDVPPVDGDGLAARGGRCRRFRRGAGRRSGRGRGGRGRGGGSSRAASTAARCEDEQCGRQKDRNPRAGSHWPSLLVVPGRVTARERARWAMTSPPMQSSAHPVVAGRVPRARSRPAREEESGGDGIGGQPHRSCRLSDAPRSVAVSSSKVAERRSILSARSM